MSMRYSSCEQENPDDARYCLHTGLTESAGDIGFGEGREVEPKGLTATQSAYSISR